ncbi:hypothetical protein FOZ62_014833, partial [Perkinsus olseni]
VSAMKHPTTTWHKDRTADLNQAPVSFLKLKEEEADAASSSVRMRAQNNLPPERSSGSDKNEKAMFRLWSELPLSFGEQWKGPSKKIPYPAFKARIQKAAVVYGLPDRALQYFLIRNLGGALREEIEELVQPGDSASVCLESIWKYLDGKYAVIFSMSESISRWEELKQQSGESVVDFCARLDMEAQLLKSSGYHDLSETDRAVRLRAGMNSQLHRQMGRYVGPEFKIMDCTTLRRYAEHHEEDLNQKEPTQEYNKKLDKKPYPATDGSSEKLQLKCSRCLK